MQTLTEQIDRLIVLRDGTGVASRPADEATQRSDTPWRLDGALADHLLNEVDVGLMVLSSDLRVRFANRTALRACAGKGFCALDDGAVRAARAHDTPALVRAVREAMGGRRSLVAFDGESGDLVQRVAFIPLGPEDGAAEAVLLMFGRPRICGPLSVQFFAHEHGITLAESRVLTALCEGLSPRHIADRRGIAISTVRSQISHIRQKTGARSIADLLRTASMLPPLYTI